MVLSKCHTCEMVMDRPGEKKPSVRCKKCNNEHCNQCADVTTDFCAITKGMKKSLWMCSKCEEKEADMKAVIDSMGMIRTELSSLKQGQAALQTDRAEQQAERTKVIEGLKAVEAVAKRMERIEQVQEKQEERLSATENAVKRNSKKGEEGEKRIKKLEERLEKSDENTFDMRQCNTVAREVREMERREKNIVIFNVPEPTDTEDDQKKCLEQLEGILMELGLAEMKPVTAGRIGKTGRYPRKILASFQTRALCEKIVKKSRDGPALTNNVFMNYDRTFNQRQEARLFRMEKEEEEKESLQPGLPPPADRGRSRGRPRGRGNFGRGGGAGLGGGASVGGGGSKGGGRGKGRGRGSHTADDESRKRRPSNEDGLHDNDDEAKRRKTSAENGRAEATPANLQTPDNPVNMTSAVDNQTDGIRGAEGGGGGGGF